MTIMDEPMVYERLPYIHVAAYLRARGFREIVADDVSSTFVHDQLDVDVLLPKRTEYEITREPCAPSCEHFASSNVAPRSSSSARS